jgi:5-hydroxyisourate hydrolase
MSTITTHILDTSLGRPAAGVPVVLHAKTSAGDWKELGRGSTDNDGRLRTLLVDTTLAEGTYRLTFDTAAYFANRKISSFYPKVIVEFEVRDAASHYHVPLLLSPFGYSTYRGS